MHLSVWMSVFAYSNSEWFWIVSLHSPPPPKNNLQREIFLFCLWSSSMPKFRGRAQAFLEETHHLLNTWGPNRRIGAHLQQTEKLVRIAKSLFHKADEPESTQTSDWLTGMTPISFTALWLQDWAAESQAKHLFACMILYPFRSISLLSLCLGHIASPCMGVLLANALVHVMLVCGRFSTAGNCSVKLRLCATSTFQVRLINPRSYCHCSRVKDMLTPESLAIPYEGIFLIDSCIC